jgi:hypothetical protein
MPFEFVTIVAENKPKARGVFAIRLTHQATPAISD